jgi:hypothetical protein
MVSEMPAVNTMRVRSSDRKGTITETITEKITKKIIKKITETIINISQK